MKKLIALLLLANVACAAPIRYIQLAPVSKQSGGFNVGTSTVTALCFDDASCQTTASSGGGIGGHHNSLYAGSGGVGDNVTGLDNVVIGNNSFAGVTGARVVTQHNTVLGTGALYFGGYSTFNLDGDNTAIGWNALQVLTDGWQNTVIGAGAGASLTTGYENFFAGFRAGDLSTTLNHSVVAGPYAGMGLQNAGGNIAIGHSAMSTDGESVGRGQFVNTNDSIIIGWDGVNLLPPGSNPTGVIQNAIGIGKLVKTACDNCMIIGATGDTNAMRVSIGTSTANSTLFINSRDNMAMANSANHLSNWHGYSLIVATDAIVNQYDLSIDTGGVVSPRILQLTSKTAAQIRALTPTAVGQKYFCSDCTTVPECVSTGTAVYQWSLSTNRTSSCQ